MKIRKIINSSCLLLSFLSFKGQNFYNGEFVVRKISTHYDSLNISTNYATYSNLYSDSVNISETWHSDNLGSVLFNNVNLFYTPSIKTYLDTVQRSSIEATQWILSSSSSLPSFTANCTGTFPTTQNLNFFPETLKKSDDFYIYFGEATNTDEIELTMFDGVLRILFPFNRKIPSTELSVSVPSADLDSLEGDYVTLTLSLIKYEYQAYNGHRFKFEKRHNIVKTLKLMN